MYSRSVALFAVVFSLAAAGCAQTEGEACQVGAEDCESGLVCCSPNRTIGAGGSCERTCTGLMADDAGVDASEPSTDAGSDAGTDAGETDAGTDAQVDAGTDAAAADTDAGVDAST